MLGNITYHSKTECPQNLQWGHAFVNGRSRFGYQGPVLFVFDGEILCRLDLTENQDHLRQKYPGAVFTPATQNMTDRAIHWLETGKNPLNMALYGTPFEIKVWKALLDIPLGQTVTYQSIAEKTGTPKAFRAVGSAVGKNPVSLIVPCHRVVNKTGSNVSYGWGADTKLKLLAAEAA